MKENECSKAELQREFESLKCNSYKTSWKMKFFEMKKENESLKAEIERLTKERDKYQEKWQTAYMNELNLQKQVDELKEKLWKSKQDMMTYHSKTVAEAVKDAAKEILPEMLARAKRLKEQFDSTTYGTNREHLIATIEIEIEGIKNLAKHYGVEVE